MLVRERLQVVLPALRQQQNAEGAVGVVEAPILVNPTVIVHIVFHHVG